MTRSGYAQLVGRSPVMVALQQEIRRVAQSEAKILVTGESGTGKELVAMSIHAQSTRADRPFVTVNCAGLPETLLESELFGHTKGSFTGAYRDKPGMLEKADEGSIFLDEIGEMSLRMQGMLLRFLETGELQKVGADRVGRRVDVRVIAATNRSLPEMVAQGLFREDLYYRINVINIHVPSLRERREDILPLVDHFLVKQARDDRSRLKKLSKACLAAFLEYSWPGNIRELENEIERLVVLAGDEKLITEDLLSSRIRSPASSHEVNDELQPNCLPDAVQDLERKMIYEVLKRNHWNKTRAAQELHISRRNLIRKVNKYNLDQRRASRESD